MTALAASPVSARADLAAAAAERLMARTPAENDAAILAAVAAILGRPMPVTLRTLFPEDGPPYVVAAGIRRPAGITARQIAAVVRALSLGMAPLPAEDTLRALARLSHLCPPRAGEAAADYQQRMVAYADALRAWPADAVLAALAQRWTWFPAWADLETRLERLTAARRALLRAARGWTPWTDDDEIARLERAIERARFDARYRAADDPDRASEAAEAVGVFERAVAGLRGVGRA